MVNNSCKPFFCSCNQSFIIGFDCKPFLITADSADETLVGNFFAVSVCNLRQRVDCAADCNVISFEFVGESEIQSTDCGNVVAYGLSLRADLRCKVTIVIVSVFASFKFGNSIIGSVSLVEFRHPDTFEGSVAVELVFKIFHVFVNDGEHLVVFRIELAAVYERFHSVDSFNGVINLSYILCEFSFGIEKGLIIFNPGSFGFFCGIVSLNVSRQSVERSASSVDKTFGSFGILNFADSGYFSYYAFDFCNNIVISCFHRLKSIKVVYTVIVGFNFILKSVYVGINQCIVSFSCRNYIVVDRIANFLARFYAILSVSDLDKVYDSFNFSVLSVVPFRYLIIYSIVINAAVVFKEVEVALSFNDCNCVFSGGKSVLALKNAHICIEIFISRSIEYGYGYIVRICGYNFDNLDCGDCVIDICFPFGNLSFCFNKHVGRTRRVVNKVGIFKHSEILSFCRVAVQFVPSRSCRRNLESVLIRLTLFGINSIYGRSQRSVKINGSVKIVLIVYLLVHLLSGINIRVGDYAGRRNVVVHAEEQRNFVFLRHRITYFFGRKPVCSADSGFKSFNVFYKDLRIGFFFICRRSRAITRAYRKRKE